MGALLFACAYWVLSVFYALLAAITSVLPGNRAMIFIIRFYCRRMLWAMRTFAGIKVNLKGQENLPEGAFIIAAKHHSWGDGFVMFANVPNLSFVTNDGLERIPLLRGILRKLGAIVVDNCGGPEARAALSVAAAKVAAEGVQQDNGDCDCRIPPGKSGRPGSRCVPGAAGGDVRDAQQ